MRMDPTAASDGAVVPLTELQGLCDARSYAAAVRLIESGCVVELRLLQGGRVLTGIVQPGGRGHDPSVDYRVYIEIRADNGQSSASPLEGECSCGEPSPCVHVMAVSIAAAKRSRAAALPPADPHRRGAVPAPGATPESSVAGAARQQLIYLLSRSAEDHAGAERPDSDPPEAGPFGGLHVSIWVSRGSAGVADGGACAFALRTPERPGEYPRYVDDRDREILSALVRRASEETFELSGAQGHALLRMLVATGRARWRSLAGHTLAPAGPRRVRFVWKTLPNGDQRLGCDGSESMVIVLHTEPAVYVDTASGESGDLEFSCAADLLREYWQHAPIAPEAVPAVAMRIASHPQAAGFPVPQTLAVQRPARANLRARLRLTAAAEAKLHWIYNGIDVDDRALGSGEWVRQLHGGALFEIERDRETERRLREQLDRAMGAIPSSREAWLDFLVGAVPVLRAAGWDIEVDPGFPYRLASFDSWYANLNTRRRHEWFDLQLGVTVDGKPVNLLPALVAYLQAAAGAPDAPGLFTGDHWFVPLEDGRYLPVPMQRIERIAGTLVELFDRDALNERQSLSLPVSQAGRLAQLAQVGAPIFRSDDPSLLSLIEDLREHSGIRPMRAPAHFPAVLRSYQEEGLGWLQFLRRHRLGGILADDMGLGKTVQTLAHLATEKNHGRMRKPSLIVAPVSVLGNWQQEIRRFTPELVSLTWHGAGRKALIGNLDAADIVLIGYPLMLIDSEMLLGREFHYLILDEAQTIKNPRAQVSQVARSLHADHRLCLTGTPMENHLGELWSLCDFALPGLLGDERDFQRRFRSPIEKGGQQRRAEALQRRVAPFLLRRTKDAVASELPPKMQIVESIVLDEKQRDFYDGIRLAMNRRVRETIASRGVAKSQLTVLDALLKLRQACCDPRLVRIDAATAPAAPEIPSAKLDWLSSALPEMIAAGRRILLFSQFTSMLSLIETMARALAIPYCLLTGESRHRPALIERFQSGAVPLFLISLKAGGTGLNLTAADTIIHYDPWWNPAVEAQATDRAHRIGQDKPVFVYKLIAQGTVEEKIMALQTDKHALASQLYRDRGASPASWSAAELIDLFAP